ncbi:MAG TPA: hypothetical protein VMT18_12805 [Planctomycetota bacterium]|nr:hypothetical protein [Planctomycetota bacterium]
MNHRLGTCSSCKAQYKVPASFQADRAKCKACGGVVEIGSAGGGAAASAPKPAASAKPVPARPVAAAAPTPKPAPKPVAEEKDSVRAAAQAAAERVRAAGRSTAAAPSADKAGARSERAGAKSGAREGSKSRSGSGGSRRAGRTTKKELNKTPLLAAAALVLVAGGGAAWFLMRGDDGDSQAAEKGGAVAQVPAADASETPEAAPEATPTDTPAEQAAPETAEETPAETPAQSAPALDDIDLSAFPDESKLPGTSDEDWASIQEWTAAFFDPNAGAAGNRARGKLFERGREAFPAVLNAMKRLDFSTEDGFRAGDLAQRFLMDVCNGTNFGWNYDRTESGGLDPAGVVYNKKVVRNWINVAWGQGRDSPKAWAKITKTELADAIELFKVTGPFEGLEGDTEPAADAASSLDDL